MGLVTNEPALKKNTRYLGLFENSRGRRRCGETPAAGNVESEPEATESDLEPELDGEDENDEPQASNHTIPTQPLTSGPPAPATQPVQSELSSNHLQHPYNYHHPPNYYPYYTFSHPSFPQVRHQHHHQQYQFQFYNPPNSTR